MAKKTTTGKKRTVKKAAKKKGPIKIGLARVPRSPKKKPGKGGRKTTI